MKNDKEKLIELVKENPNLPLVFMVSNDEIAWDYGTTVYQDFWCHVSEVYVLDEEWSDDFDYVVEKYSNDLCDDDKYKNMTDEEFEQAMKEYVNMNVEHYKAIVIYVG